MDTSALKITFYSYLSTLAWSRLLYDIIPTIGSEETAWVSIEYLKRTLTILV